MIIRLLAIGKKMPPWVTAGYTEYARRMGAGCKLELKELTQCKAASAAEIKNREGQLLLKNIPRGAHVVALDVLGESWDTGATASALQNWKERTRTVCILVGGPEGLSAEALSSADQKWSLSPLTFPHPLVRIIVAEQLYRANSLLCNHPYHRA